jgi:hypothetical protein
VETHKVVRRRGSHIFYITASQGAVRLSFLWAGRQLFTLQEDSWYSFLLEADSFPASQCGWKDCANWKKWQESNPWPSGVQHSAPPSNIQIIANNTIEKTHILLIEFILKSLNPISRSSSGGIHTQTSIIKIATPYILAECGPFFLSNIEILLCSHPTQEFYKHHSRTWNIPNFH